MGKSRGRKSPSLTIRLLVIKGKDAGELYETSSFPFIIGRDKGANFSLTKDSNISRYHAKISRNGKSVSIQDLKSTNGSIVNNVKITRKTALSDGSIIILGKTSLKLIIAKKEPEKHAEIEHTESTFYYEPRQTEAILVLDQCNSSQIIDVYGDEACMELTEAMNNIVLPIFKRHTAQFIKGTGDGFLATFADVHHCVRASEEILKSIRKWNLNKSNATEIHVRIGMHYGKSLIEPNGDRHGQAVIVTFRTEGLRYRDIKKTANTIAPGHFPLEDRVFITREFYHELDQPKKKKFRRMGSFRLKGIKGYHTIYAYRTSG
ncbi:MAG: FHA domain-containing protein [Spirochaetales bacterium]|nr:FHA domain-containing protein [Spirochaetales bacterium]